MLKFLILISLLFFALNSVNAEDNYCYQKPEKCASGDVLILSISTDVAKYCDFDKQIISVARRTTADRFNNEEIVCVKAFEPRTEKK